MSMVWRRWKVNKCFLNLKKKKILVKALLKKLEVNGKEICNQAKINGEIKIFFEETFKEPSGD